MSRGGRGARSWPRITLVTPSLNQGAYLEATIASVLAQGYPDLEYFVMDGGSTDGSVEVIRRHAPRLAGWTSAPDAGQADAIARGFARGSGEILGWVNSDDFLYRGALRRVGAAFASDPGALWLVGGYARVSPAGRRMRTLPAVAQDFASLLCAGQGFGQPAVFWRRSLYERVGGLDTALRFCFDYDLFIRFARVAPPRLLGTVLAAYRDHPETKTNLVWESVAAPEAEAVRRRHGIDAIPPEERARIARAHEADKRAAVGPLRGLSAWALAGVLRAKARHLGLRFAGRRSKFARIYRDGGFGGPGDPGSGSGSSLAQTAGTRRILEDLVRRLGVRRVVDAPCGDFTWMAHCDLGGSSYVGADIVPAVVAENRRRHAAPGREFLEADLVAGPVPAGDLVLSRDCLVHLSNADARRVLRNFAASGARWLLATTFPGTAENRDLVTGRGWRPVNLEKPPFSLPPPEALFPEGCTEEGGRHADKALGLWDLARLRGGAWGRAGWRPR